MASYRNINYSLRPAKSIERKMLCDAFRKLSNFARIGSYRYVGFGSTYFSDFSLFHKSLGMTNMVSIEKDMANAVRFQFNCPFRCIEMKFGYSRDILPQLAWDVPTILWLDYDSQLDRTTLSDLETFCTRATPGSMIVVTVNAHPERPPSNSTLELREYRYQQLVKRIGEGKIPQDVKEARGTNLTIKQKAKICRRLITQEIIESLAGRNITLEHEQQIKYQQLFNFTYQDGAKMLTVGGVVYEKSQTDILQRCEFEQLDFVRSGEESFAIEVPTLTFREIHYLASQLPLENDQMPQVPAIPEKDVRRYALLYRYFPTFAEAEL